MLDFAVRLAIVTALCVAAYLIVLSVFALAYLIGAIQ